MKSENVNDMNSVKIKVEVYSKEKKWDDVQNQEKNFFFSSFEFNSKYSSVLSIVNMQCPHNISLRNTSL